MDLPTGDVDPISALGMDLGALGTGARRSEIRIQLGSLLLIKRARSNCKQLALDGVSVQDTACKFSFKNRTALPELFLTIAGISTISLVDVDHHPLEEGPERQSIWVTRRIQPFTAYAQTKFAGPRFKPFSEQCRVRLIPQPTNSHKRSSAPSKARRLRPLSASRELHNSA